MLACRWIGTDMAGSLSWGLRKWATESTEAFYLHLNNQTPTSLFLTLQLNAVDCSNQFNVATECYMHVYGMHSFCFLSACQGNLKTSVFQYFPWNWEDKLTVEVAWWSGESEVVLVRVFFCIWRKQWNSDLPQAMAQLWGHDHVCALIVGPNKCCSAEDWGQPRWCLHLLASRYKWKGPPKTTAGSRWRIRVRNSRLSYYRATRTWLHISFWIDMRGIEIWEQRELSRDL